MMERPYKITLTVTLQVNGDSHKLARDHLAQCFVLDGAAALLKRVAADGVITFGVG